MLRYTIDRLGT